MNYTPKPWQAVELKADGRIVTRPGGYEITTPHYDVCAMILGRGPIRKWDDAVLMAHAPDLIEALQGLVNAIAQDPGTSTFRALTHANQLIQHIEMEITNGKAED